MLNTSSVSKQVDNKIHVGMEIIIAIYGSEMRLSRFTAHKSNIIWFNDNSQCCNNIIQFIQQSDMNEKETYIIDSTNNRKLMDMKHYISIRKNTSSSLILGYIHYYLTNNSLPKYISSRKYKTRETFVRLIEEYSVKNVSKWTGLNTIEIHKLYQLLDNGNNLHHHLVVPNSNDEANIQSIRCISLLPLFICNPLPDTLPLSIEGDFYKKSKLTKNSGEEQDPFAHLFIDNLQVELYDWDFADQFDVDPYPVFSI